MYDELVKRLRCQRFGNCPNCPMWYTEEVEPNLWRERCAAIDAADAIEVLSEMETTTPRWISVEERVPENDCNCIVFSDGYVKESHFYFGKFYDPIEDYMRYKATHWMPLPKPPKEET